MPATESPVEEAERILHRMDLFRSMKFSEADAQRLAQSDVPWATINALLRKGCPRNLVARILT